MGAQVVRAVTPGAQKKYNRRQLELTDGMTAATKADVTFNGENKAPSNAGIRAVH